MKCINRKKIKNIKISGLSKKLVCVAGACALALSAAGCSSEKPENAYALFETTEKYGLNSPEDVSVSLFAHNLCVVGMDDFDAVSFDSSAAGASGIFDITKAQAKYADNIYERLYPASTTKLLTCLIAVKYGNLQDEVTVSQSAIDALEYGSSTCGLEVGDTLTMEDLIYGMMLESGNDAANVIAEHISGSIEEFAKLMNKEAKALGATGSHFVNANGLHSEDHYTTAYDLYLIFNAGLEDETFYRIISTDTYNASYRDASGGTVQAEWSSTNQYLSGDTETPDGITVIGGKTGTTSAAGSCLVLLTTKDGGDTYISVVLKAQSHDELYSYMSELISTFE